MTENDAVRRLAEDIFARATAHPQATVGQHLIYARLAIEAAETFQAAWNVATASTDERAWWPCPDSKTGSEYYGLESEPSSYYSAGPKVLKSEGKLWTPQVGAVAVFLPGDFTLDEAKAAVLAAL